ncbi:MAG: acyl carrier protein [Candidatus Sulfotelmatobacter sp.]
MEEESKTKVQDWLKDWFGRRSKRGHEGTGEFLPDVDYFAAGWLTSMEVVEFVTEIEQKFGIQFSDDDMQDQRFVTIAGLAELILQGSTQSHERR